MKPNPRRKPETKREKKLSARIRDFATMKPRYQGQFHKPGSNKK